MAFLLVNLLTLTKHCRIVMHVSVHYHTKNSVVYAQYFELYKHESCNSIIPMPVWQYVQSVCPDCLVRLYNNMVRPYTDSTAA